MNNKIGMTINEASAYCGVGRNTLRKLTQIHVGKKCIIRTELLEQFSELNQGRNLPDFEQVQAVSLKQ